MTWRKAEYPGDSVRQIEVRTVDGQVGDVRIQQWDEGGPWRVAAFIPGRVEQVDGDTPKTAPDLFCFLAQPDEADRFFDLYLEEVAKIGWKPQPMEERK